MHGIRDQAARPIPFLLRARQDFGSEMVRSETSEAVPKEIRKLNEEKKL
jgi:hypothetical protein